MPGRNDEVHAQVGAVQELPSAHLELQRLPAVRALRFDDGVGMERYRESTENFDLHFTSWHQEVWKPVITAVNGICAAAGFHWVADADIVIAASDAQFFECG